MLTSNLAQLAKLKDRFATMALDAKAAIEPSLNKSAAELVVEMKHLAPKDSGALANSIVATPAGQTTPESALGGTRKVPQGGVTVTAGNRTAFYAGMVEFGTSKMHAEPFFRPACRIMRQKITGDLKAAITAAVRGRK